MNLSLTILVASLSAGVVAGIIITIILLLLSKKLSKSKQAELAKELKQNKELEYITLNIKQLNSQLQLENTQVSKLLDAFDVNGEKETEVENFVLAKKAQRQALTTREKRKATAFKI